MKEKDIYLELKKIVEPIHHHSDQLLAIAHYIKSEFADKVDYKIKYDLKVLQKNNLEKIVAGLTEELVKAGLRKPAISLKIILK